MEKTEYRETVERIVNNAIAENRLKVPKIFEKLLGNCEIALLRDSFLQTSNFTIEELRELGFPRYPQLLQAIPAKKLSAKILFEAALENKDEAFWSAAIKLKPSLVFPLWNKLIVELSKAAHYEHETEHVFASPVQRSLFMIILKSNKINYKRVLSLAQNFCDTFEYSENPLWIWLIGSILPHVSLETKLDWFETAYKNVYSNTSLREVVDRFTKSQVAYLKAYLKYLEETGNNTAQNLIDVAKRISELYKFNHSSDDCRKIILGQIVEVTEGFPTPEEWVEISKYFNDLATALFDGLQLAIYGDKLNGSQACEILTKIRFNTSEEGKLKWHYGDLANYVIENDELTQAEIVALGDKYQNCLPKVNKKLLEKISQLEGGNKTPVV